ncbi:HET-domain-containing protein [Lophiostoma macrostomum CBS 122681]|uniref:HET-domain-containing protein n=1 Tax=Lophiostoma macrostomum CBS 122681 TaxID=1314788 RepID=A0A6A6T5A9_9PLEO|nr:HET-domain-containing protein [Lophiostoma macrostomum CBS 122681]
MERCFEVLLRIPEGRQIAGIIIRANSEEDTNSITPSVQSPPSDSLSYRGRPVPLQVDYRPINHWVGLCETAHGCCQIPLHHPKNAERIRLIDVRDYRLVPAYSGGSNLSYVALSYVWGKKATGLLTRDNLRRCMSSNGLENLAIPLTIINAIEVVKSIGARYLWVDSLCIVQDDDSDKMDQLPMMGRIYGCAHLVIVAAAGHDAYSGLPGVGKTERMVWRRTEMINGVRFITGQPTVREALRQSVWATRGWTFQDGTCSTKIYCGLVEAFSGRCFTDDRDVLWAFAGILKLVAGHFPKGFIWGLPYDILDAALLWAQTGCTNVHLRSASHPTSGEAGNHDIPFPSWSWLSCSMQTKFLSLCHCDSPIISEVTWHESIDFDHVTADRYLDSILPKRRVVKYRDDRKTNITEYGLLHLTARSSILTLKRIMNADTKEHLDPSGGDISGARTRDEPTQEKIIPQVKATLHTPNGEQIGVVNTFSDLFSNDLVCAAEVILLSSNVEDVFDESCKTQHVRRCEHITSRNVMLIEWIGDVACRRGIGTVEKGGWEKVVAVEKRIILG